MLNGEGGGESAAAGAAKLADALTKVRLVVSNAQALDLANVGIDGDYKLLDRVALDGILVAQHVVCARAAVA